MSVNLIIPPIVQNESAADRCSIAYVDDRQYYVSFDQTRTKITNIQAVKISRTFNEANDVELIFQEFRKQLATYRGYSTNNYWMLIM